MNETSKNRGHLAKQSQLDKFKEAARELETDDDEAKFNERLRKVAKQKRDDKKASDWCAELPHPMGSHITYD